MTAIRTSKTKARFSRRAFLHQVGASAALVPLLEAERALAAPGDGPKRIVTIAWGNGVAQPMFYPPADDPTASPIMQPLVPLIDGGQFCVTGSQISAQPPYELSGL